MIEELRRRNKEILNQNISSHEYLKQSLINKILSDDKCFESIDICDALNILIDLGYNEDEIKDIYESLLNS